MSDAALYYDRAGEPITSDQWVAARGQRIVAQDVVGRLRVSTVWLGIDHGWGEGHPPVIFETMIFGPWDYADLAMWRYSTERDALLGHDLACDVARRRQHGLIKHARDLRRERARWHVRALNEWDTSGELGELVRMGLALDAMTRKPS